VVYAAGLMLVGLELGLLIGVLAGLASIVPYLGMVVGIGAALTAGLFQFGGELYPLLAIAAVFMVGQMLEGMLLTPWLVGDRIGLHPVAVIFAIMAGGQLFGFSGILLALPVAAVIMVLLRHAHDFYKLSTLYGESPSGSDEPPSPA
jgi:predicted PurR-regulated permease PerM